MTFDDVRKMALAWPEVEDGSSYGTPALKVRKKMLARLKEDGDSLVMPGVPQDERDMLVESQPKVFYFTDHYKDYPYVLIRLSKTKRGTSSRCCAGNGGRWRRRRRLRRWIRRGEAKARLHRAHHLSAAHAFTIRLDRWALHRTVGTEHAAIARQRFQLLAAAFADVEELARIRRHFLGGLKAAPWAGQGRFQLHCASPKTTSSIP